MPTVTTTTTRPLELGAVTGVAPTKALPAQPVPGPAPWGALEGSVAINFSAVQTVLLPAGTILRRVFGYPDAAAPWPSWETGSWWTRQPLPATEATWRAAFAVEANWSGGQCVVTWTTPQEIHAWVGPAAPQSGEYADGETAPNSYLPGGGEQIYIAAAALPIGTWATGLTPWASGSSSTTTTGAAKPPPSTATATTTAAKPTAASLALAVGKLAGSLDGMANEATTIGLDGSALSFQAKQLKRYQARLQKYGSAKFAAHQQAVAQRLAGIARHIHTQNAWSRSAAAATAAMRDVVGQAGALASASKAAVASAGK